MPADLNTLTRRAELTAAARLFFHERTILEIDVPCIQRGANLDHGVELLTIKNAGEIRYLATSPEHSLKRIIADHNCDCYALCPAFRHGEHGTRHSPEFRMPEWYRLNFSLEQICNEVCTLADTLCNKTHSITWLSYREAFQHYAGIDPFTETPQHWRENYPAMPRITRRRNPRLPVSHPNRTNWEPMAGYGSIITPPAKPPRHSIIPIPTASSSRPRRTVSQRHRTRQRLPRMH